MAAVDVEEPPSADANLKEAVQSEQWADVVRFVSSSKCSQELTQWALKKVVEAADDEDDVCGVLDYVCGGDDVVVPVFWTLMERSLWEAVDKMVSSGKCGDELRCRAVDEVVRQGDDDVRISRIVIKHCTAGQVDTAMAHLVRRGRWACVRDLVKSDDECTAQQRHWALEELVKHAPDDVVCDAIHLCAADQRDAVWSHLLRRGLGNSAYVLMKMPGCSDEQRSKAVDVAAKQASGDRLRDILDHCASDQADSVWSYLIRRGLWDTVLHLMNRSSCSEEQRQRAIDEAIKLGDDKVTSRLIHHCAADQVRSVLHRLIGKSLWRAAYQLMNCRMCSEYLRREAAVVVLIAASYHCGSDQVGRVLSYHVHGAQWIPVAILLNGVTCSDGQRRSVLEKLTKHAPENIVYDVIDRCPLDGVETVLSHLITRYMWRAVGLLLQRGISGSAHEMAVREAVEHANACAFNDHILPHCAGGDVEQMITRLMSRSQWEAVGGFLKHGVSDAQRGWVVEEAIRRECDHQFVDYILPHCVDDQMEQVMTHLVSSGLWEGVGQVLKRGFGEDAHRQRAIEKASQHAYDDDFVKHILPHCVGEDCERVLPHLVSRGQWQSVGGVLNCGVSDTQHSKALEEGSQRATGPQFVQNLLPRCTDQHLEQVMPHLVSRGVWQAVGELLNRCVGSKQHQTAVEAASQRANDDEFVRFILPQCDDEELEQVMPHLVSRGLWEGVDEVLKCGVSEAQYQRAMEEAIQHANNDDFIRYALLHCVDEGESERAITHLMAQSLWSNIGAVLRRGVSAAQHKRVVEEASQHASAFQFAEHVLPQCTDEELEKAIPHLVSRGLWYAVGEVLKRGIMEPLHRWAVKQSSRDASDDDFERYILRHCSADELVSVLPRFVANGRYDGAGQVLRAVVCDTLLAWATTRQNGLSSNTLFWKLIRGCGVGLSHCLGLCKAVTQNTRFSAYHLAERLKDGAQRKNSEPTSTARTAGRPIEVGTEHCAI